MTAELQGPPVTPNGPTAQGWLAQELAKSEYAASRPTWFDQLSTWIHDWLDSLFSSSIPGVPGVGPLVILAIVVVAAVLAFLIFGLPRLNRRSRITGELFGVDDERSAAQILADARAARARGDYSLAVLEGMRASARVLTERTLVNMYPGTTAHEFARSATQIFPELSELLTATANAFDSVRYLDRSGTEEQWRDAERLATVLRTASPAATLVSA